jgi:nucleoside-diphosphate-sugar epimerase
MILITGATGFIGKKLLPLIKNNFPKEKIFEVNEKKYNLVTGKNLDKIPEKPRIIIHLAASTDTSEKDQRCNDLGTKNLLDSLRSIGPSTHFIYTSSQAIFSGRIDDSKFIDKNTKPSISNKYGKTKLKAENLLIESSKAKGFKLTIIRLPTVWGYKNQRKNSFMNFLAELVASNSFFSRIDWPGKIGLINVNDVTKFIIKKIKSLPKDNEVISICSQNMKFSEIFKVVSDTLNVSYKKIELPNFVWVLAKAFFKNTKHFENLLPTSIYNYLWRASIVIRSPLACEVNIPNGIKFKKENLDYLLDTKVSPTPKSS